MADRPTRNAERPPTMSLRLDAAAAERPNAGPTITRGDADGKRPPGDGVPPRLHAVHDDELLDAAGYAVGIDVGGTNTKLGLVDPNGQIVFRETVATEELSDPNAACERFAMFAADAIAACDPDAAAAVAVGVAVPGILNGPTGELDYVANLPAWRRFPLKDALEQTFNGPVAVANDANAAAFAEHSVRNLQNESLALLTLGTGIGCGVVLDGQPFSGDHGCGFEVGHVPVDFAPTARRCGCDKPGHLEAYVGAAGVILTAREQLAASPHQSPGLHRLDADNLLTPEKIASEAEAGDIGSQRTVDLTARWVGIAASLIGQTLDPAYILLGGAMTFGGASSATGRRFLAEVIASSRTYSLDHVADRVEIAFATLGNDAGICGISELARLGVADADGESGPAAVAPARRSVAVAQS